MIQQVLEESDLERHQITGLIWSAGPGSFTGVRIATSVAQGISYALNLPLYPCSSLELTAKSVRSQMQPGQQLLVAEDARMGEIYWASFEATREGIGRLSDDSLSTPKEVPISDTRLATGSAQALLDPDSEISTWLTSSPAKANYLLPPLADDLNAAESLSALQAEPHYLRGESAWKRVEEQ